MILSWDVLMMVFYPGINCQKFKVGWTIKKKKSPAVAIYGKGKLGSDNLK